MMFLDCTFFFYVMYIFYVVCVFFFFLNHLLRVGEHFPTVVWITHGFLVSRLQGMSASLSGTFETAQGYKTDIATPPSGGVTQLPVL